MKYLCILAVLLLGGCASYQDRARTVGGQVFEDVESASALVLDAAVRYICKTARVDAVTARFKTPELRKAWSEICKDNPELPK